MVDLNTLITPPSPIHLQDAWNINERGEIFANGRMPDGTERAVVLVPIPAGHSSTRSFRPERPWHSSALAF